MTPPPHASRPAYPAHDAPQVRDALLVRDATGRLLADVAKLDEAALTAPSQLPGWTRGHVLAHLARNADALVKVLAGRPMYESAEARDADIERDAHRPPSAHLDDVRDSASRLDGAFAAQSDEAWQRTVELRNGVTDLASSLPFRRWVEVELHHVDLGTGYGLKDLPGAFVERQLAAMARRFSGHPGIPQALELRTDDGVTLRTGAQEGKPLIVTGDSVALLGWITGRSTGSGLSASAPLPALPGL